MGMRSLSASLEGTMQAKQMMSRKRLTQQFLAEEVGLKTRQSVGRFLAGKAIERRIFMEICFQLDLDWQEIAVQPPSVAPEPIEKRQGKDVDIDALVQRVRSQSQDKIQAQYGSLQLLDIPQLIDLAEIYVDVDILEEIPSRKWLEIPDLLPGFNPSEDEFDRLSLGKIEPERLPGLEAIARYSKLMVLGKPGTGKTTFLKFVASECNQGKFQPHQLPIFIWLKYFVEDARDKGEFSLLNYICQELANSGISTDDVKTLLTHGKLLILLDGLDEVPQSDSEEVIREIRRLSQRYYKNQFAIASRNSSQPYYFQGFTEVEVADFSSTQIEAFAEKYFVVISRHDREEGLTKATKFIEHLWRPENRQIRELAVTPLLLNLACLVFQSKAKFPSKRIKLYEEALDILLVRWDRSKGIKRDEVYQKLSLAHKIKLLNQVGAIAFEQEDYFFEQNKIQKLIADYLRLLPNAETDPVALKLDSEAVLKSIELQHGLFVERSRRIYSFSHLAFQEYFTARYITAQTELEIGKLKLESFEEFKDEGWQVEGSQHNLQSPNLQPPTLQPLVSHIFEKRWREVFLLVTEMSPKPENLLGSMKQEIDLLTASDEKLQQFLRWVNQKSELVPVQHKRAAVRAFYFSLALALDHYWACALNPGSPRHPFPPLSYFPLPLYLSLASALDYDLTLNCDFAFNFNVQNPDFPHDVGLSRVHILEQAIKCALHFDLALAPKAARELLRSLQSLKAQLPKPKESSQRLKTWWQNKGLAWTKRLKAVLVEHHHDGHDWQFSEQQKRSLQQYYHANKLLVDCLKRDRSLTAAVQEEIEESLLLPTGELVEASTTPTYSAF